VRSRKPLVSYVIVLPSPTLIPVDRIAAQIPAAGAPVTLPVSVRLTLAGVPRPADSVTVPNVMGLLADEAVSVLRNRSLAVDRLEKDVTAPDSIGRVTGQNPVAGTRRAVGGTVAIAIGRDARPPVKGTGIAQSGPASQKKKKPTKPTKAATPVTPLVKMPWVVGRDSAAATRILRDAGLRNYLFRIPVNAASADIVRLQIPDSGRRIRASSMVVLTLRPPAPPDPTPFGGISTPVVPPTRPFPWLALLAFALTFVAASAATARRVWPAPQIAPRIRLEPMFTDILGANGSLVDVSISLSSHVEHEQSVLDLTGSSFD
jgi:hypothetical protein